MINIFIESLKKLYSNQNFISTFLVDIILSGIGILLSFLPSILIIFIGIRHIGQVKFFKKTINIIGIQAEKIGLDKKSITSIIAGLGCSIPAYISTRIIRDNKKKLLTIIFISFVPCRAKMTLFIMLSKFFFSNKMAAFIVLIIYIITISFAIVISFFLSKMPASSLAEKTIQSKLQNDNCKTCKVKCSTSTSLMLEVKEICKSYTLDMFKTVSVISCIVWFLSSFPHFDKQSCAALHTKQGITQEVATNICAREQIESSFVAKVGKAMDPIFKPIGFDWKMNVALIFGTFAKELSISIMNILYGIKDEVGFVGGYMHIKDYIPYASGMSFMVFMMFYMPCVSAMITFSNESKNKTLVYKFIAITTILSWMLSFFVYNILK